MDENALLKLALDAGEIMLTSGAETHRVEDTMHHILSVSHNTEAEALAMSTLLIVSLPSEKRGSLTLTRGVHNRSVNFQKICEVNALSRDFVSGRLCLAQTVQRIEEIRNAPSFSPLLRIFCYGIAAGGFTIVLTGTPSDGLAAFFCGVLIGIMIILLGQRQTPYFFTSLLGGFLSGVAASLFHRILPSAGMDMIIVGSIMPLLPGITMTNAIRDIMEGNFISGNSKLVEALLVAFAIAGGVGFGVSLFA